VVIKHGNGKNTPFHGWFSNFSTQTSIYRRFPIATFDRRRVILPFQWSPSQLSGVNEARQRILEISKTETPSKTSGPLSRQIYRVLPSLKMGVSWHAKLNGCFPRFISEMSEPLIRVTRANTSSLET
jgi:hypothetical protein